jgi:hypothetical protein
MQIGFQMIPDSFLHLSDPRPTFPSGQVSLGYSGVCWGKPLYLLRQALSKANETCLQDIVHVVFCII